MADYSAYKVPTLSTNYGSGFFDAYDGLVSALQTDVTAVQAQIVTSGLGLIIGATAPTGSARIDGGIWVEISGTDRIEWVWNSAASTWDPAGIDLTTSQTATSDWTMQGISGTRIVATDSVAFSAGGLLSGDWAIGGSQHMSGTVDLRTGTLKLPIASSVDGTSGTSAAAVLDKADGRIYTDIDGTGYKPQGGGLYYLSAAEIVASGLSNGSYTEIVLSNIADDSWAVNLAYYLYSSNDTVTINLKPKGSYAETTIGHLGKDAASTYTWGQATLPVGSDKAIWSKLNVGNQYTLYLLGYWK